MVDTNTKKHTDIKSGNKIERFFPPALRPYALLMRLDRPIGTWLLLLPGWWSIILAGGGGSGIQDYIFYLLILFAMGAIIMRGAGCIINDLWDREFDRRVARTSTRPLAAGTVTPFQALIFLAILLSIGLSILWQMSLVTVLLGFMALPLIILYPLMKRWTWWPQLFLGVVFNFGALMGWTAVNDVISLPSLLLYIGGIFWTLGYDTIYAHQDKEDDMKIGIRSTALYLKENSKNYVTIFYTLAMMFFILAFSLVHAGSLSIILLLLGSLHLWGQIKAWDMDDPENSLEIFKSNQAFGLFVLLAAIL